MREGAALPDERQGFARFRRQIGHRDVGDPFGAAFACLQRAGCGGQAERKDQNAKSAACPQKVHYDTAFQ